MKKSAITRIIIYSLLILLLGGLLCTSLSFHRHGGIGRIAAVFDDDFEDAFEFDDDDDEDDRAADRREARPGETVAVPGDSIQKIQIDWVSGNLTVEPGDVENIELRETESKTPMTYSVSGDKLVVQYSKKMKGIHFGIQDGLPSKDLTVTVPIGWMGKELEIHSVSADVEIRDLQLENTEYQGVSGKCLVENARLGELSVQTVSGNVTVNGEIRELDCESVSADCDLTVTNVPEEISMEGVSGSLYLTLPENAGFTVELDGLNKNLDTDFEVISRNGKFIAGDGTCEIEIEGVSGSAKIRKAAA